MPNTTILGYVSVQIPINVTFDQKPTQAELYNALLKNFLTHPGLKNQEELEQLNPNIEIEPTDRSKFHPTEPDPQITMQMIVAANDSNGTPEFFFVKVTGTKNQYELGEFHAAAANYADRHGYESKLVYDELDSAGRHLCEWTNWTTVRTITTDGQEQ